MEDILYYNFIKLSKTDKLKYLNILLVEQDFDKLLDEFGPKSISVLIEDDLVIIEADSLKNVRTVKNNLMLNGLIIVDEQYEKVDDTYLVSYIYEGHVQPICLN
jgi:hypothetical protein